MWQLEKGDKEGYVHWQITMTLNVKQRLSWLKNHFAKTAHCEIVNNIDAAFDYSQKNETRLEGPYYWPEPIKKVKDPLEGKELYEWQRNLLGELKEEPDDRKIIWVWENKGRAGKTALAKHIKLNYSGVKILGGKSSDIAHAVGPGTKICIFNLTRDDEAFVSYKSLEMLKDGLFFSGKYESTDKVMDPPHVVIMANFPPKTEKMSMDRWDIREITLPQSGCQQG